MRRSQAARARNAVLMYDLKFLGKRQQAVIVDLQRRMVEKLGGLLGELAPALRQGGQSQGKSYALLLFGMLNWTFTWLKDAGPLIAPIDRLLFRLMTRPETTSPATGEAPSSRR